MFRFTGSALSVLVVTALLLSEPGVGASGVGVAHALTGARSAKGFPAAVQDHWGGDCELYPQRAGDEYEAPECYVPDRFVANDPTDTNDHSAGQRSDYVRNGLYQRWIYCGTACWLLINDVDREMFVFDGYVSKTTVGASDDPYHFLTGELTRIQKLANFLRYLGSLGYTLEGVFVWHFHGDHTVDTPVLLRALRLPEGGRTLVSRTNNDYYTRHSDVRPEYPPINDCVPVIVDRRTFGHYIVAGHGDGNYNPSTHYVLFDYPGCPETGYCPGEHDKAFSSGQKFNISRALVDVAGNTIECPDCTHGQFRLGHFEFNAYVWDHQFSNENRTFAFRLWHSKAPGARRTFITGSAGEMTNDKSDDMFVSDHEPGHSHDVRSLLQAADDVFGDHEGGRVWTDMLILAFSRMGENRHQTIARTAGQNIRFYERRSGPDAGSGAVGYVLASHHDQNAGTGGDWEEDYLEMLDEFDEDERTRYSGRYWHGQDGLVQVLGRQVRRMPFGGTGNRTADWWRENYLRIRDEVDDPVSAAVGGIDRDCDGVRDDADNCPLTANGNQLDADPANGVGDACEGLSDGCVFPALHMSAWWRFDETENLDGVHADSAGGYDATDADWGAAGGSLTTPTGGYVNGGLRMDGRRDWLRAGSTDGYWPDNLTIDAWIKTDRSGGGTWGVLDWATNDVPFESPELRRYAFAIRGDGELEFIDKCRDGVPGSERRYFTTAANIDPGVWTHVAVSHEQDTTVSPPAPGPLRFYVNGREVAAEGILCSGDPPVCDSPSAAALDSVDLSGCDLSAWALGDWTIGRLRSTDQDCGDPDAGLGNCFDGVIDELEVFQCPLEQADIAAIARAARSGKCKAPRSFPPLLTAVEAKCVATINKAAAQMAKAVLRGQKKCHARRDKGKIPQQTDCNAVAGIDGLTLDLDATVTKLERKVSKRCPDQSPPADAGYHDCPPPCDGDTFDSFTDVADCEACLVSSAVETLAETVFGNPSGPLPKEQLRCHKDLLSIAARTFNATFKLDGSAETSNFRPRTSMCVPAAIEESSEEGDASLDDGFDRIGGSRKCATVSLDGIDSCSASDRDSLAACVTEELRLRVAELTHWSFGLSRPAPREAGLCGDGVIAQDAGEQCDPPYESGGEPGCSAECISKCGDGAIETSLGEECDDGGGNSDTAPDACRSDCRRARCGDGVVDEGEACDDGNSAAEDACTDKCEYASCGDGRVCSAAGCISGPSGGPEDCDPPYDQLAGARGCRPDCGNACGNGVLEPALGEECDDGIAGNSWTKPDACRPDCTLPRCGDEVVDSGEQCDPEAGCSAGEDREIEQGPCPQNCELASCGDGFVCSAAECALTPAGVEDCDPPYANGGELGCAADCTSTCGDGVLDASTGEECDTGGPPGTDPQSANCDEDCSFPVCGDGIMNELAGEACDDGAVCVGGNDAGAACLLPDGDECAPGSYCVARSGDGCSAYCLPEICKCSGGSGAGNVCQQDLEAIDCPGGSCECL